MLTALLTQTIDDELGWREPELALAKVQLQRSLSSDDRHFRYAYRAFVAMTYAHYEGFAKRTIAQALSDIYTSGTKPTQCVTGLQKALMLTSVRKKFTSLSNDDFMQSLSDGMRFMDTVPFPKVEIILECGNLNVENFLWAVSCVGLSPITFESYRPSIGRLTTLRHNCAHGEVITFDSSKTNQVLADEMYTLQQNITILMHLLAVELVDLFTHQRFLASPPKAKGRKK
jgi:hypothetical protein